MADVIAPVSSYFHTMSMYGPRRLPLIHTSTTDIYREHYAERRRARGLVPVVRYDMHDMDMYLACDRNAVRVAGAYRFPFYSC